MDQYLIAFGILVVAIFALFQLNEIKVNLKEFKAETAEIDTLTTSHIKNNCPNGTEPQMSVSNLGIELSCK